MPFVDTNGLKVIERLPGWKGRYFHSTSMTFAHYEFAAGSSIHEHFHPEEEVYEVIEGELEVTIDGKTQTVKPGVVAVIRSGSEFCLHAQQNAHAEQLQAPFRDSDDNPVRRRTEQRSTFSHIYTYI